MLRFGVDWPSHQGPASISVLALPGERRHVEFAQYKERHAQQHQICHDQANRVMQIIPTPSRNIARGTSATVQHTAATYGCGLHLPRYC